MHRAHVRYPHSSDLVLYGTPLAGAEPSGTRTSCVYNMRELWVAGKIG